MIQIKVSSICEVNGCPAEVMRVAKEILTIPNPAYFRVARITGNDWAAQRDFKYYKTSKVDSGYLAFPRGFASRFIAYLDKMGMGHEVSYDFINIATKDTTGWPEITLRDYQVKLCEDIVKATDGIVAASVGSGKTVLACWLTRHFAKTTTILVPNTVIQKQFVEEFKKWFNYDIGVINGTEKNIKDITVSTWQSLSADKSLLERLSAQTTILVVDEAHSGISPERAKILKAFKPSRLFGLSGSPRRSKDDGRTDVIFFYFGGIIASHMMPQVKPVVEVVRTGVKMLVSANYHEMVDNMVVNESRNKLIMGLAVCEAMSGKKVLILLKRIEHCRIIKSLLPDWGDMIFHADGEDKSRNDTLLAMRAGQREFSILLGTFSLLSTGLDIPSLDVLIIGADLKTDVGVEQSCGRILRLFEGKDKATIYDLFDFDNPIFKRQAIERYKFYKQKGWDIKGVDWLR